MVECPVMKMSVFPCCRTRFSTNLVLPDLSLIRLHASGQRAAVPNLHAGNRIPTLLSHYTREGEEPQPVDASEARSIPEAERQVVRRGAEYQDRSR